MLVSKAAGIVHEKLQDFTNPTDAGLGGMLLPKTVKTLAHFLLPIPGKSNSDWSYSWVPVVGPLLGAIAGVGVFQSLH